jgi:GT2 family glycosyltransferase/glycosyltransferase involved in cell wall biosynthesis
MATNSEIASFLSQDLEPVFWTPELLDRPSAWWGHVPFAFWLVAAAKPRRLVELGTHHGVSYTAFCEAVVRLKLDTRCSAVDTWAGDPHAGLYGDEVYAEFKTFHDSRYGAFSDMLRQNFDAAAAHFPDGSIDLLHIDGYHTYAAVRHDFETWRAKLSSRAVVLFHDTNVRRDDFGVWQFFAELKAQFPAFEFLHAYGLGVVQVGPDAPEAVKALCALGDAPAVRLRQIFSALGARWSRDNEERRALITRVENLEEVVAGERLDAAAFKSKISAAIAERDAAIAGKDAEVAQLHERNAQAEATIAEKQALLQEAWHHLDRMNASPWWRFGMWVTELIQNLLRFIKNLQLPLRVEFAPLTRNLRNASIALHGDAAIDFPSVVAPEVSIIIPAYRGLADLEACLRSLSFHRATEPSFEVIVLDDCPDEPVLSAIPSSDGLIKITNEKNLGFLRTCNRGAAAARGHILCFLNSDTVVSAGWLRSLVEALAEVPKAAIAGGMLLNADGTIQDAGWRILEDGWGYSIGRGDDPRNGSYTYRRSVDCVTGACFVVTRRVWNDLGGFDTAYAPAFYEEFDLAFRAQARGLQVIYEPRSRVLHLGSASYGAEQRDQLSAINHAKFCERFADVLRKHPSDKVDEFTLRHASGEGTVLLVIDDRVPQPDQHAGDVTMSVYLTMLATDGWRVVFGPMNGQAEGLSAEALERQGIELIRAPITIEEWLTKYGKHVREVWLARPEVAKKMLSPLRVHTDAHITYYTHDLHHLRLQRQAELHSDSKLKVVAAEVKVLECEIFHSVDRVTTPSAAEAEIVRRLSSGTPVTVLPPYHYDDSEIWTRDAEHFAAFSDVVFVGGFPHSPNVDAAIFIANEIMPLVWRERPDVRLLLIGYAPPAKVQALAGPRIMVTGQVPKLEPFFDAARVFLAALRYGAGVKGKIVQAMRLGLPVVTTPIGAEGIGIEPGFNAMVAEDASGLARCVLELLHDAERCAALSKAGAELVRHQFSRAAARSALNEVFTTPRCDGCGSDRLIGPPLKEI